MDFIKSEILDESLNLLEDTPLNELGIDSFSVIELVLFLERKHGIKLQEKNMLPENFRSVSSLAKCAFQSTQ